MQITSTLLVLLFLLAAHVILLPLLKRRPVFIKGLEGALICGVFLAVIASLSHQLIYFIAVAVALLMYYTKSWIVYGISQESIDIALSKAALATRALSTKVANGYKIDNNMTITTVNLGMGISLIRYVNKVHSKKSELTKEIFRKFIQNYFI